MLERPASDRYDVLLEAFRKGASVDEVRKRTAHRPVVPARSSGRWRSTPTPRWRASAPTSRSTPARPSSPPRTPYYYSGLGAARGPRGRARRATERGHPRQRPESHRPGHRVRLLLRARRHDRPRVRPRRGDDQLQPRDGLHRLRHLRSPLLRAADPRGRPRRHRDRAAGGRGRPVRRPDAAQAGRTVCRRPGSRSSARASTTIDLAEDRGRFGALLERLGYQAPPYATAHSVDEALEQSEQVGFPLLVRPSYVLGGRAMEIVYSRDGLADYLTRHARDGRRDLSWTASWRTRSRSTSTPCATARTSGSAGSCSTSRRPASTPATRPACCPRTRWATRCSTRSGPPRPASRWASGSSGS